MINLSLKISKLALFKEVRAINMWWREEGLLNGWNTWCVNWRTRIWISRGHIRTQVSRLLSETQCSWHPPSMHAYIHMYVGTHTWAYSHICVPTHLYIIKKENIGSFTWYDKIQETQPKKLIFWLITTKTQINLFRIESTSFLYDAIDG